MNQEQHERFVEARQMISAASAELRHLNNGFAILGMEKLFEQVESVCGLLDEAARIIHETTGKVVIESFQQSQEASHNVIRAAIAGMEMGARSREKEATS